MRHQYLQVLLPFVAMGDGFFFLFFFTAVLWLNVEGSAGQPLSGIEGEMKYCPAEGGESPQSHKS